MSGDPSSAHARDEHRLVTKAHADAHRRARELAVTDLPRALLMVAHARRGPQWEGLTEEQRRELETYRANLGRIESALPSSVKRTGILELAKQQLSNAEDPTLHGGIRTSLSIFDAEVRDFLDTVRHMQTLKTTHNEALELNAKYDGAVAALLDDVDFRAVAKPGMTETGLPRAATSSLYVGSTIMLLDKLMDGAPAGSVFLDVGCRAGGPSFCAAMMFPEITAVGFDAEVSYVEFAKREKTRIAESFRSTAPQFSERVLRTKFGSFDAFTTSTLNPATHVFVFAPQNDIAWYVLQLALSPQSTVKRLAMALNVIDRLGSVLERMGAARMQVHRTGVGRFDALILDVPNDSDERARVYALIPTTYIRLIPVENNNAVANLVSLPETAPQPPPPPSSQQQQPQPAQPKKRRVALVSLTPSGPQ